MGMWENDIRSGRGLIVTLDGIYNEGRFSMNKLMVGEALRKVDERFKNSSSFPRRLHEILINVD